MTRTTIRTAVGSALVGLVILAGGCTGSEELVTQPGSLSLEVVISPAGSGRYETATMQIRQVSFRPVDPDADASLGNESLAFLPSPASLTFQSDRPATLRTIPMTEGTYRVERVVFSNIAALDSDPVSPGATCLEQYLASSAGSGRLPPTLPSEVAQTANADVIVSDFNPVPTFTITRAGATAVRMVINGPGLLAAYESAFTCRTSGLCGSSVPAPCLSGFTPLGSLVIQPLIRFE